MSKKIEQLIKHFQFLPGIGEKTAQRLTYYIFSHGADQARAFAQSMTEALDSIQYCRVCRNLTEQHTCDICNSEHRDKSKICIVEHPSNILQIEQTHSYNGLYFVLHGALSPIDGITPEHLKVSQLLRTINSEGVEEMIIATSTKIEGEATAYYLSEQFKDKVNVTRLAHGLPIGGTLDYIDSQTLLRAFHARHTLENDI
ncbi:recombination mediator RecR [Gammaproteobacteria bacterium]|nr:recombination mediator RecR [Gammaproteobacteria bacterium]